MADTKVRNGGANSIQGWTIRLPGNWAFWSAEAFCGGFRTWRRSSGCGTRPGRGGRDTTSARGDSLTLGEFGNPGRGYFFAGGCFATIKSLILS